MTRFKHVLALKKWSKIDLNVKIKLLDCLNFRLSSSYLKLWCLMKKSLLEFDMVVGHVWIGYASKN